MALRTVPTRLFSSAATCRAPIIPQTHCADAGDPPAARRDRSRRSGRFQEIPDGVTSATRRKTFAGKESYPRPACAAPSACPSSPTPPCPRRAARLAGYSPQRRLRAPSTPNRLASTSTHVRIQKPVATPCPTLHAEKAAARRPASSCPSPPSTYLAPRTLPSPRAHAVTALQCRSGRGPAPPQEQPASKPHKMGLAQPCDFEC